LRFVYNDSYTLRGAVHELAGSRPIAKREHALPFPVVKGRGYREVALKSNRRKGRQK
jgi:hypothetical protein